MKILRSYYKSIITFILPLPIFFLFQNCGSSGFESYDVLNSSELMTSNFKTELLSKTGTFEPTPVTPPFQNGWKPIKTLSSTVITVDDFPVNTTLKRETRIREFFGHKNYYNKISYFFHELEDVYEQFNIKRSDIVTCDVRHKQALDENFNSMMRMRARNYFCTGEFNTEYCKQTQYKKVYLNYCLDKNDTLDWLVLQATLLNAAGRTVVIPASRTFNINQALVIPSNTKIVWQWTKHNGFNGRSYTLENASFIKFRQLQLDGFNGPEPLDNVRGLGFSTGTVVTVADMPFIYSGEAATRKPGVARNIELFYPHIDGSNFKGENGISFAQGVENIVVTGGHIKNIKVNPVEGVAWAGGKAVQCEAGCKQIKIKGMNISNAHIGINSNAISTYSAITNGMTMISDIAVDGILMENVDLPVSVLNDYTNKAGTQKVRVNNFLFLDSGRMSDDVYLSRRGHLERNRNYSRPLQGLIDNLTAPTQQSMSRSYDLSPLTSRGGFNVILSNGKVVNSSDYGGIEEFLGGYGTEVKILNTEYSTPINCLINRDLRGC